MICIFHKWEIGKTNVPIKNKGKRGFWNNKRTIRVCKRCKKVEELCLGNKDVYWRKLKNYMLFDEEKDFLKQYIGG